MNVLVASIERLNSKGNEYPLGQNSWDPSNDFDCRNLKSFPNVSSNVECTYYLPGRTSFSYFFQGSEKRSVNCDGSRPACGNGRIPRRGHRRSRIVSIMVDIQVDLKGGKKDKFPMKVEKSEGIGEGYANCRGLARKNLLLLFLDVLGIFEELTAVVAIFVVDVECLMEK